MRVYETRLARNVLDAALVEVVLVDAVQSRDVGIAPGLEARPVVAAQIHVEAVVGRMLELVPGLRRIPHDFLRHAAHVDAGSAESAGFDRRGLRAVFCGALSMGKATATTSDDQQIVMFRQIRIPLSMPLSMLHAAA